MKTILSGLSFRASRVLSRPLTRTSSFGLRTSPSVMLVLAVALLVPAAAWAYPPSPYHLICGMVRDEYGTPLMNEQAQILLVTTGGTQAKTFIQPGLAVDVNYQLRVPLDSSLKPDLYRSGVVTVGTAFKMYVVIGNATNVPIVSATTITNLGEPTKMTRIDLFLGVDSNGDGIPDAWERAFLARLGPI